MYVYQKNPDVFYPFATSHKVAVNKLAKFLSRLFVCSRFGWSPNRTGLRLRISANLNYWGLS